MDLFKRNKATGKAYKITSFSKDYAKRNGTLRHYISLFKAGECLGFDGWYSNNLRHAKKDGENFIKTKEA